MSASLFDPAAFGDIALANRIVMAPLTRGRAGDSKIPNTLMAEYYAQRAGAGLIVSEATAISAQGFGWAGAPGIYSDEMTDGWRIVTDAVHARGGKMVLQLWHMGRLSHPVFLNGALPVAPSALQPEGQTRDSSGNRDYVVPRALDAAELPGIVQDYVRAAGLAMAAGFDGVEIHGANGYLLDQFLRDGANVRTDSYGGSIENRLRFPLEVVEAVTKAIGSGRTGIRLSPTARNGGTRDGDPVATFTAVAHALNDYDLAYVHVHEAAPGLPSATPGAPYVLPHIRKAYRGNLIVNGGYDGTSAKTAIENGDGDAVAFGVKYLANPDLAQRIAMGASLNAPDPSTFYTEGAKGYTDYPMIEKAA